MWLVVESTGDKALQLLFIWKKKSLFCLIFAKYFPRHRIIGRLLPLCQCFIGVFHCLRAIGRQEKSVITVTFVPCITWLRPQPLAPLFGFLCICPEWALMSFFPSLCSESLSFFKNFDHYLLKYISDTCPLLAIPNLHRWLEIFYRSLRL